MDRSAALRVALGWPPAASKALTVAQATLGGLLLADRTPPDAMTRLSMVRSPGSVVRAVDPATPWAQGEAGIGEGAAS